MSTPHIAIQLMNPMGAVVEPDYLLSVTEGHMIHCKSPQELADTIEDLLPGEPVIWCVGPKRNWIEFDKLVARETRLVRSAAYKHE